MPARQACPHSWQGQAQHPDTIRSTLAVISRCIASCGTPPAQVLRVWWRGRPGWKMERAAEGVTCASSGKEIGRKHSCTALCVYFVYARTSF